MAKGVDKYKHKHFKQGLCICCPRPAVPGKLLCKRCAEVHRKSSARSNKKYYQQRKDNRLCVRCGTPLIAGEKSVCTTCASSELRREKSYAKGQTRFTI
jgi:hypothetical protein